MDISFIHIAQAATEAAHEAEKTGIAGMFGLDLKLFLAQLINFGIVLLVLWRWVFRPVTAALQKRTERIEQSLKTAETIETEKVTFTAWKEKEMQTARTEAGQILLKAKHDADALKAELLATTAEEQKAVVQRAKRELESAEQRMLQDARASLAELVVTATEKVIGQKLTTKADQQLVDEAIKALEKKG